MASQNSGHSSRGRRWTENDMKHAIELLRNNPNYNLTRVAVKYNLPRTTLRRAMIRAGIKKSTTYEIMNQPKNVNFKLQDKNNKSHRAKANNEPNGMPKLPTTTDPNSLTNSDDVWTKNEYVLPSDEDPIDSNLSIPQETFDSSVNTQNYLTFNDKGTVLNIPIENVQPIIYTAIDLTGKKRIIIQDKDSMRLVEDDQTIQISSTQINIFNSSNMDSLTSCSNSQTITGPLNLNPLLNEGFNECDDLLRTIDHEDRKIPVHSLLTAESPHEIFNHITPREFFGDISREPLS